MVRLYDMMALVARGQGYSNLSHSPAAVATAAGMLLLLLLLSTVPCPLLRATCD
jgi:hypothetical protein